MKILLLNPSVDAEHGDVRALQGKGYVVLIASTATEAWQVLQAHGESIALAVVHREGSGGQGEPGLHFIDKFRNVTEHSDLPYIITTEHWSDAECAVHQQGDSGANAYLRAHYDSGQLVNLVEAVVGPAENADAAIDVATPRAGGAGARRGAPQMAGMPSHPSADGGSDELVLEDASEIFSYAEKQEPSDTSIRLEAPAETGSISAALEIDTNGPAGESGGLITSLEDSGAALDLNSVVLPEIPADAGDFDSAISIPTAMGGGMGSVKPASLESLGLPAEAFEPEPTGPALDIGALSPVDEAEPQPGPDHSFATIGPGAVASRSAGRSAEDSDGGFDSDAYEAMPYVFGGAKSRNTGPDPLAAFAQPLGDAVVPGGASDSPDVETLKKYLLLREQDVAALTTQLKTARDQVRALDVSLHEERARAAELEKDLEGKRRRIEDFEREKAVAVESVQREVDELKFQLKSRSDKAKVLASKLRDATDEIENLKERVRADIRKIRVREKELENRLEILRKDSEALIAAREGKIIELKRRLDLIEFNMDLVREQYRREKETSASLREKLGRAAQAMRVAGGLLDSDESPSDSAVDGAEKVS